MTFITAIRSVPTRRHALAAVLLGALLAMPATRTDDAAHSGLGDQAAAGASPPSGGAAHGVLTGPGADYMRRRFDATTPIEIDVATLHALPQPGCARLEVTTRQRDVLEQGKRADQELRWQVSFCRTAVFPEKR